MNTKDNKFINQFLKNGYIKTKINNLKALNSIRDNIIKVIILVF